MIISKLRGLAPLFLFAVGTLGGCGGELSPQQGGQLIVESESPTQMAGRFYATSGAVLEFDAAIAEGTSIKSDVIYQGAVVLSVSFTSRDSLPSVSVADGRDPIVKSAAQEMATALTAKYTDQVGASAAAAMILSTGLAKVFNPSVALSARVSELVAPARADRLADSCRRTCCRFHWGWNGCCLPAPGGGENCTLLLIPYCC